MTFKQHCIVQLERAEINMSLRCYAQYTGKETKQELLSKILALKPDYTIEKYDGVVTDADKEFWYSLEKPDFEQIKREVFEALMIPTKAQREKYGEWYRGECGIEEVSKLMLP